MGILGIVGDSWGLLEIVGESLGIFGNLGDSWGIFGNLRESWGFLEGSPDCRQGSKSLVAICELFSFVLGGVLLFCIKILMKNTIAGVAIGARSRNCVDWQKNGCEKHNCGMGTGARLRNCVD